MFVYQINFSTFILVSPATDSGLDAQKKRLCTLATTCVDKRQIFGFFHVTLMESRYWWPGLALRMVLPINTGQVRIKLKFSV
jgi:hypothetical protein